MTTAAHAALMAALKAASERHAELMAQEPQAAELALRQHNPNMPRERLLRLVVQDEQNQGDTQQ
jgi:hypothetical protein